MHIRWPLSTDQYGLIKPLVLSIDPILILLICSHILAMYLAINIHICRQKSMYIWTNRDRYGLWIKIWIKRSVAGLDLRMYSIDTEALAFMF